MANVYLAFGSNLGNREEYIKRSLSALKEKGIKVRKVSRIIETDPAGGPLQGKYLNAVALVQTDLSPEDLHVITQSIENSLGRIRHVINGPRTIDIDVLLYDDIKLISRTLIIPHPRMFERDFVMGPLIQIAPEYKEYL